MVPECRGEFKETAKGAKEDENRKFTWMDRIDRMRKSFRAKSPRPQRAAV
jgi:hypothetical protein